MQLADPLVKSVTACRQIRVGALVMLSALPDQFVVRCSLGLLPSPRTLAPVLIKPVMRNVDFVPYSAGFWQKMAEFCTILHKKWGLKMDPFANTRLDLG